MIFCVMRDEFWQKLILEILLCCGFLSVVTPCQMSKTLNLQFHGIFCIIWRHVKILSKCFDEKAVCPVIWWTIGKEKPDFVYRKIFKQVFTERENHPPPYPHIHTHNQKQVTTASEHTRNITRRNTALKRAQKAYYHTTSCANYLIEAIYKYVTAVYQI